jgi:hypothetical protein
MAMKKHESNWLTNYLTASDHNSTLTFKIDTAPIEELENSRRGARSKHRASLG